mmetsp:Transcript_76238/g.164956  ORF Transcript_76238/g.164956 Transcript_76238/m.164956 type:complete len:834 (-) Transcript_76238:1218-3719(-)
MRGRRLRGLPGHRGQRQPHVEEPLALQRPEHAGLPALLPRGLLRVRGAEGEHAGGPRRDRGREEDDREPGGPVPARPLPPRDRAALRGRPRPAEDAAGGPPVHRRAAGAPEVHPGRLRDPAPALAAAPRGGGLRCLCEGAAEPRRAGDRPRAERRHAAPRRRGRGRPAGAVRGDPAALPGQLLQVRHAPGQRLRPRGEGAPGGLGRRGLRPVQGLPASAGPLAGEPPQSVEHRGAGGAVRQPHGGLHDRTEEGGAQGAAGAPDARPGGDPGEERGVPPRGGEGDRGGGEDREGGDREGLPLAAARARRAGRGSQAAGELPPGRHGRIRQGCGRDALRLRGGAGSQGARHEAGRDAAEGARRLRGPQGEHQGEPARRRRGAAQHLGRPAGLWRPGVGRATRGGVGYLRRRGLGRRQLQVGGGERDLGGRDRGGGAGEAQGQAGRGAGREARGLAPRPAAAAAADRRPPPAERAPAGAPPRAAGDGAGLRDAACQGPSPDARGALAAVRVRAGAGAGAGADTDGSQCAPGVRARSLTRRIAEPSAVSCGARRSAGRSALSRRRPPVRCRCCRRARRKTSSFAASASSSLALSFSRSSAAIAASQVSFPSADLQLATAETATSKVANAAACRSTHARSPESCRSSQVLSCASAASRRLALMLTLRTAEASRTFRSISSSFVSSSLRACATTKAQRIAATSLSNSSMAPWRQFASCLRSASSTTRASGSEGQAFAIASFPVFAAATITFTSARRNSSFFARVSSRARVRRPCSALRTSFFSTVVKSAVRLSYCAAGASMLDRLWRFSCQWSSGGREALYWAKASSAEASRRAFTTRA